VISLINLHAAAQPISWQAGLKLEHRPSFFNEGLFYKVGRSFWGGSPYTLAHVINLRGLRVLLLNLPFTDSLVSFLYFCRLSYNI